MKERTPERHTFMRGHALGMSPKDLEAIERSMQERLAADAQRRDAALLRSYGEAHRMLQSARKADENARAAFRLEHSRELVRLSYAEPRTILRLAMEDLPGDYKFGWSPEQLREAKWWIEFEARITERAQFILPGPAILSAPNPIVIGAQATVLGRKLGSATGSASLVDCNGNRHGLTVQDWTDEAVRFDAPAAIGGIPYDCMGTIELTLADGQVLSGPRALIEPLDAVMFSRNSFSAIGSSIFSFSQSRSFSSAQIPVSFRELIIPPQASEPHAGNVLFRVSNVLVASIDGGVHVDITSGPVISNNTFVVSTRLTDDHVWNFTVSAEFLITVPNGIPAAGWTAA